MSIEVSSSATATTTSTTQSSSKCQAEHTWLSHAQLRVLLECWWCYSKSQHNNTKSSGIAQYLSVLRVTQSSLRSAAEAALALTCASQEREQCRPLPTQAAPSACKGYCNAACRESLTQLL
eukprot:19221-Heterococcus_DN1.PRE.3